MVLEINFNYSPKMLRYLVELGVFRQERFSLIDVGCSGGIHPAWRLFKDQLEAYGFDPKKAECARLSKEEENPNMKYFACWVGLDEDHEFLKQKKAQESENPAIYSYFNQSKRTSSWSALQSEGRPGDQPSAETAPAQEDLSDQRISIAQFVKRAGIQNIDMIKIDTDGSDLEVAVSCQDMLCECNVLGFMIESRYYGSFHDTVSNFANIDRFMRQNGFCLYAMSVHCYSRADLPMQFEYPLLASTVSGQPKWGDLVYFRDAASPEYSRIWDSELSTVKLLKLACAFELFSLPDCAAELINKYSGKIAEVINPTELLDRLTPPLDGVIASYEEYTRRFRENPYSFYPKNR